MARSNRRSRRRRSRNQRGGFFTNPFAGMFGKKEEKEAVVAPTTGMGGDMHTDGHNPYATVGGRRRRRRRTKRRRSRKRRKSRKRRRKSRKSKRRRRR